MSRMMTAELALLCALDKVVDELRVAGWPEEEAAEWSLTYGRHSVYATATLRVDGDQQLAELDAFTGFLPWKRRALHRSVAIACRPKASPLTREYA